MLLSEAPASLCWRPYVIKTQRLVENKLKEKQMGILDKAKEISGRVSESVTSFSSDEVIANTIIKAVEKQEKVNLLLQEKGSNYRVSDIELGMGIPPTITFGVRRIKEDTKGDPMGHAESAEIIEKRDG